MSNKKLILIIVVVLVLSLLFTSCGKFNPNTYIISGRITNNDGLGIEGVTLYCGDYGTSKTNSDGKWQKIGLLGVVTIIPAKEGYSFEPTEKTISGPSDEVNFISGSADFYEGIAIVETESDDFEYIVGDKYGNMIFYDTSAGIVQRAIARSKEGHWIEMRYDVAGYPNMVCSETHIIVFGPISNNKCDIGVIEISTNKTTIYSDVEFDMNTVENSQIRTCGFYGDVALALRLASVGLAQFSLVTAYIGVAPGIHSPVALALSGVSLGLTVISTITAEHFEALETTSLAFDIAAGAIGCGSGGAADCLALGSTIGSTVAEIADQYEEDINATEDILNTGSNPITNQDPIINNLNVSSTNMLPNETINISVDASDPDNDTLSYDWSATGGNITGTGSSVTYTAPNTPGTYTITVIVADGRGGSNSSSIDVTISAANQDPIISNLTVSSTSMQTNETINVTVDASDPDNDTLSYNWSVTGGSISGTGSSITYTAPNTEGIYTITVTVDDGKGGSNSSNIDVSVSAANQDPIISNLTVSSTSMQINETINVTVDASDLDNDTLSYNWSATGGSIIGTGSSVTYTAPNIEGTYIITVIVDDGEGGSDTSSIDVIVSIPTLSSPKIAFVTDRDGCREIYTMNIDGTDQTRLTYNQNSHDWNPSWSPDGRKIAYSSGIGTKCEVYVMNIDGSNQTRLTYNNGLSFDPSWSPDGSKIAYSLYDGGNSAIYIINLDGTNQTRLTYNSGTDRRPTWSPDGSKIAFFNGGINIIDVDGTNQFRLDSTGDEPAWSPDGSKIVFMALLNGSSDIYSINIDGTNKTRLTDNYYNRYPSWSPDGSKIIFSCDCDGNLEIFVMDADGSNKTRLTNNSSQDRFPSWSPDI